MQPVVIVVILHAQPHVILDVTPDVLEVVEIQHIVKLLVMAVLPVVVLVDGLRAVVVVSDL